MKPLLQALTLAAELESMGFRTAVIRKLGHMRHPCIWVTSNPERQVRVTQIIYTAPDDDGVWWFWFADTLEPIAPATQTSIAADIISAEISIPRVRLFGVRVL